MLPLAFSGAADIAPDSTSAILYPADNSVVTSDLLLVTAIVPSKQPPALTMDGKPLAAQTMQFDPTWLTYGKRLFPTTRPTHADPRVAALLKDKSGKMVLLATTTLTPGQHVLELAGRQTKIFRSQDEKAADAPPGMAVFHTHGPVKDPAKALACTECHEPSDNDATGTLGLAKTPTSCHTCHSDVDVQLIHRHVTDILNKCQTCHDPHGTTRPKLLVDSQEKVCTLCHEGGHSKR